MLLFSHRIVWRSNSIFMHSVLDSRLHILKVSWLSLGTCLFVVLYLIMVSLLSLWAWLSTFCWRRPPAWCSPRRLRRCNRLFWSLLIYSWLFAFHFVPWRWMLLEKKRFLRRGKVRCSVFLILSMHHLLSRLTIMLLFSLVFSRFLALPSSFLIKVRFLLLILLLLLEMTIRIEGLNIMIKVSTLLASLVKSVVLCKHPL